MINRLFALCWMASTVVFLAVTVAVGDASVRVTLRSLETHYVVGQPVKLHVKITNASEKAIPAWLDDMKYEIAIYVSEHNERFEPSFARYYKRFGKTICLERSVEDLKPRESKTYQFRILYPYYMKETPKGRMPLPFEKPGKYFVKVRYPLYPNREMFESNTIELKIKQPKGADAKVWEVLNKPEFLYFLQTGFLRKKDQEIPVKTAKLLRSVENSSYHPALRHALGRYYHRLPNPRPRFGDVKHGKLFRSALGIEEELVAIVPLSPTRILSDRTLDVQRVTYHFPNYTPLKEVLDEISRQTGVSLQLGPGIHETSRFRSVRKSVSLREFMQTLVDPGRTTWVHEGNGFRLISVEHGKK